MRTYDAERDRRIAEVILETLERSTASVNVDRAMEERYVAAIMAGLRRARRKEKASADAGTSRADANR